MSLSYTANKDTSHKSQDKFIIQFLQIGAVKTISIWRKH